MQVDNRLLDDLARVASGALGALSGVRGEVETQLKQQFQRILGEMDLVTREEFEAVKQVAANARTEQERLEKRLARLEAAMGGKQPKGAAKPAAAKKPAKRAAKSKAGR